MASGMGIGSSQGPQQNNFFIFNDPTSAASSTGVTGATQAPDPNLQSFIAQLESAMGGTSIAGQSASAGTANPLSFTSAQTTTGSDADGDNDASQAQTGQVSGHHHGHHHHTPPVATDGTSGQAGASGLQSDVNSVVNDLFGLLQQTGSSSGTNSTPSSSSTTSAASDPSTTTTAVTSSPSASTSLQNDVTNLVNDVFSLFQ